MDQCKFKVITEAEHGQRTLRYEYETKSYYDVSTEKSKFGWSFSLTKKELGKKIFKSSESELFKQYVDNSRVYQCHVNNTEVGIIHIGYEEWSKRARIWDILVSPSHRGQKFGSKMMDRAIQDARQYGARMIVLETQSCNVPAINFYLKHGFDLVGLDTLHYTNDDITNKRVRLEFGRIIE